MRLLVFIMSWVLLLNACSNGEKTKKHIIPQGDMVNILEDIHLANGLFSMSYLRKKYPGTDSISNYRDILARYGYSLKDFQNTVTYYTHHMIEYENVYDQVTKNLNELQEQMYDREMQKAKMRRRKRQGNLWTMKTEWHLPREGQRDKISFHVLVNGPGIYTLSMRIRISKDDGSRLPFVSAYFWYDDGTEQGHRIYWKKKRLIKGNDFRQYILAKELKDKKVTWLKGYLLDDENKDTLYIKHADVKDIRLDVKPFHTGADTTKIKR